MDGKEGRIFIFIYISQYTAARKNSSATEDKLVFVNIHHQKQSGKADAKLTYTKKFYSLLV
jgi:hypothetical protein